MATEEDEVRTFEAWCENCEYEYADELGVCIDCIETTLKEQEVEVKKPANWKEEPREDFDEEDL